MKQKIPLEEAEKIAQQLVYEFTPYCERIEVAGSIRRHKLEVGDIEIVCIPKFATSANLFGEQIQTTNEMDYPLNRLSLSGWRFIKNGNRFKQMLSPTGISLDLFICLPPAQWGVLLTLRTGPSEFSQWVVTQRRKGGALPSDLQVRELAVWRGKESIPTPEEDDFLGICGLAGTPPHARHRGMPLRSKLGSQ